MQGILFIYIVFTHLGQCYFATHFSLGAYSRYMVEGQPNRSGFRRKTAKTLMGGWFL